MNKSELIEAIANSADLSKASAGRALEAALDTIRHALQQGDAVAISGFGNFYVEQRPERPGRNPMTGEAITIQAANLPKFRAGKGLRDALN